MGRGITYNGTSGLSFSVGGSLSGGTNANRVVNISTGNTVTFYSFATGSTVFSITGVNSTLLTVTDTLTGDLFTVTDVSGNTLFRVNATSAPLMANIASGNTNTRFLTIDNSGVISYATSGANGSSGTSGSSGSSGSSGVSNIGIFQKSVNNINGLGERWFSQHIIQPASMSSRATAVDTLYLIPVQFERTYVLDRVGINISVTGASNTRVARLGLYEASLSGTPSVLDYDWGTVTVGTAGLQAITINSTVTPGLYYFAIHTDSNATLIATPTTALYPYLGAFNNTATLTFGTLAQLSRSYGSGLPTNLTSSAMTLTTNVVQYTMYFRISNITA